MTPRKQRPDPIRAGERFCRRNTYDETADIVTGVCGKPLPAGELTFLALNTPSGHYLELCAEHRDELEELYLDWASTSFGSARLLAHLSRLPGNELVSDTTLRECLDSAGIRAASRNGPLTQDERELAKEIVVAQRRRQVGDAVRKA